MSPQSSQRQPPPAGADRRAAVRPDRPPDPAHNLPLAVTSFIGRERELAEVRHLLGTTRLLTLTGAGGVGKTRLALEAARSEQAAYPDGVWLVDLAALADPRLVPQAVATTLGVRERAGRTLTELLVTWLARRHLLLVLDNCEHLIEACAALAETLLSACARLIILATSREALGIGGETTWRVPSLSLPARRPASNAAGDHLHEQLLQSEAVQLFLERAAAARPGVQLTAQNAPAVVRICWHLDGIPLALELAAARSRSLPIEQLADLLADRFHLLTGGSRTALPRQRTLRATIDWSYELLSGAEQTVLRRAAVFAGGWTLAAAQAVCVDKEGLARGAAPPITPADVLDLLGRLVDKSLVQMEEQDGAARYRLLETVRQYAWEQVQAANEERAVRDHHRDWCLALAEQAAPALFTADQVVWLTRLEADHDNLRAALAWCLETAPDRGLCLAGHLWYFWRVRAHFVEGRQWLETFLARSPEPTPARVTALLGAGMLASHVWDRTGSRARHEEGVALARLLGDKFGTAYHLRNLGAMCRQLGEYERARALLTEGLALVRELGDRRGESANLHILGQLAFDEGDVRQARRWFEEGLAPARLGGDRWMVATLLESVGLMCALQGEYQRAQALLDEELALTEELAAPHLIGLCLLELGRVALWQGDLELARTRLEASLALAQQVEEKHVVGRALMLLAQVAQRQEDLERAAALLEESLALVTRFGWRREIGLVLQALGQVTWRRGDRPQARSLWEQSLWLQQEMKDRLGIAQCFEGIAMAAAEQGQPARAARLLGAAEGLRVALGVPLPPVERPSHEATLLAVQSALGARAFATAWAAGRMLSLEQAVTEAVGEEPARREDEPSRGVVMAAPWDLTPREIEVLRLLAHGATNAEIAAVLSISVTTVNKHVVNVLDKTGCPNRTAAAAFALQQGIA